MPQENTVVSMSGEVRRLVVEGPPPTNLLPINAVFPELYYRDGQTGRATINFNMSCEENAFMPNPIRLVIKTPYREIYNQRVRLSCYCSSRYSGRNMKQAEVTLSEMEFAQIDNNPDAEVTFSGGDKESTFTIHI